MWINEFNLRKLGCIQVSIVFHNSRGLPNFMLSGRLFFENHLIFFLKKSYDIHTSEANVKGPALLND